MNLHVKVIDEDAFKKAFDKCKPGEFVSVSASVFEIPFKELKPYEGFEKPVNEAGEPHPLCCKRHREFHESLLKWFEQFPNCCDFHRRLNGEAWFNKEEYADVVRKISDQTCYTEQYIEKVINEPDWQKKITDYFEVNVDSFGQLKEGFGVVGLDKYLGAVENYVRQTKTIPSEKRPSLLSSLENIKKPVKTKEKGETDLNVLINTYRKWLKVFPFEIQYFANLKEDFQKQLPILTGEWRKNVHSGIVRVRIHDQSSLIVALVGMTKRLLEKIDVKALIEQGAIPDINAHQFSIESELLKINCAKITQDFSTGELAYLKALKEWFILHKKYFEAVKPLMQGGKPPIAQPVEKSTTKLIDNHFDSMDRDGWRYAFRCKADYETFRQMMVDFFEHKEVNYPENALNLKPRSKTKLAKLMNAIYKDLGEATLRSDTKFFMIIRQLAQFSGGSDEDIYASITK